jgi:hypothetical protein
MARLLSWIGPHAVSQAGLDLLHQAGLKKVSIDQSDRNHTLVLYPGLESIFTEGAKSVEDIMNAYALAERGYLICALWRFDKIPLAAVRNLIDTQSSDYRHESIGLPNSSDPVLSILTKEILRLSPQLAAAYRFLEDKSIRFGSEPDLDCVDRLALNITVNSVLDCWSRDYHDSSNRLRRKLAIALGHLRESDEHCAKLDSMLLGSHSQMTLKESKALGLIQQYRHSQYRFIQLISALFSANKHQSPGRPVDDLHG